MKPEDMTEDQFDAYVQAKFESAKAELRRAIFNLADAGCDDGGIIADMIPDIMDEYYELHR